MTDFKALNRMMFEETYRTIDRLRSMQVLDGKYVSETVEDAWQLWQAAKASPEYINRSTVELVQDLLNHIKRGDVFGFERELRKRGDTFLFMHKDKVDNVLIGPWEDRKV